MIIIYGLLAIMVLLRLAMRNCWLVAALGQNERCHGRLDAQRFCFLLFNACCASKEAFFYQFARNFLAERSFNVGFGEILLVPFST
jgi:hypothetical protein